MIDLSLGESVMLILAVVALCVAILLILLARRGAGSMGQKEVRKRMKHLL